jgi:hypothetical protein
MIATHSLPVIRVRVPCANDEDYRRRRAAEFLARGVVVPSDRARAIGSRVRLRIELLDHTFAYDGDATVARSVQVGERRGYLLKLAGAAEAHPVARAETAEAARSTAAAESEASTATPTPVATSTPTPTPVPPGAVTPQGSDADLASFLFSDLNLAEAAAAAAAAASAAASPCPAPASPSRLALAARAPAPRAAAAAPRASDADAPPRVLPRMELVTQEDDRDLPPARPSRRRIPRAAPVAAAVLLCVAAGGGALVLAGPTRADAEAVSFATELRRADDRIRAGRLAGTGNDSALDHLVTARDLVPDDPRLARRLKLVADLFGELGERALSRGDVEEAAVHFQAMLRADPRSAAARQRLREIAERTAAPPPAPRPGAVATR